MASSSWRWWTTDTYFGISAWASLASAMMSTCMGRSPLGHLLENYQVAAPRSISGTEITPIVLYNQAFPHQEPDEAFPPVWITLRRKAAITTPSPRLGVLWRTRLGVVKARIRIILKQTEVRIDNVIAVVRACCIYTMSARRPMTAWTSSGVKDVRKVEEDKPGAAEPQDQGQMDSGTAVRAALDANFEANPPARRNQASAEAL